MANYQSTVPNQLGQAQASNTAQTLYTVPPNTRTYLKDIDIANSAGVAGQIWVYLVPEGGTPGVGNVLIPGLTVPANGIVQWNGTQVLLPGSTIQVLGVGAGLSVTISGGEAT